MEWLESLRQKTVRYAVGLVSGSSCEGIDAALVRIKGNGPGMLLKLVRFQNTPYTPGFRNRLLAPRIDQHEAALLDFELGERFAEAGKELLKDCAEEVLEGIDFVALQGHNLSHIPPRGASPVGALQVGQPAIIAERLERPVVSGFCMRDMAAGGQGAPLMPYADWLMFARPDRAVAILSLGGVSTFTVVPPRYEDILAFDAGPATIAIDGAVRLLTSGNYEMDTDGEMASKGVVIDEFLEYLLEHPFFSRVPPKSTSREEFAPEIYLRDALNARRGHSLEDLLATVTESVAFTIIRAYNRFIKSQFTLSRLIVSGGGAQNKTLMRLLKKGFDEVVIRKSDDYGIPREAREAIAFAILGNETLSGSPANVPQATGAKRRVVLGHITPP